MLIQANSIYFISSPSPKYVWYKGLRIGIVQKADQLTENSKYPAD